ncbi:MAG: hypothetical protein SF051_15595, partial [Elusimicrobiota bacterium]|nr:hypothetical protein [Elusimicrobiota bacterium]
APAEAEPAFLPDDSVRGKTVVMVGTKGSRPFIMEEAARVAKELGITLVLVDDPANRANSAAVVPDSHFIAAPIGTRSRDRMDEIAQAVARHPEAVKAEAVVGFMSLYAALTGKVTDKLGAKGIPGDAVSAADDKPEARRRLNAVAGQEVPFAELETEADARAAYRAVSDNGRYKVVIKTNRGENSRFLALGLDSEEAAAAAFLKMDAEVEAFTQRPEAAHTTFATHPGLMMERMLEKAPGSEETSVEAVMQNGRLVSAMVSDTMGIGENGRLAGGLLVFPSQQGEAVQRALVEATEKALLAMGIRDGNARLDLMVTPDGARVVEVNPLMGGVAIWAAVKSLTGMSLVEQGLRAVLGLKVDPGHAADGVVHYLFTASGHTGTVERVAGMEDAKAAPGVVVARSFVSEGDTIAEAGEQAYEEWGEVIGKGRDWREAIANAVEGARRMILTVRKADGTVVEQRGDHLQPTADELVRPAKAEAPPLFSKLVLGFLSTFLLVSTVVESTSLAVSAMTQPLTAGFLALAALTSVSYGAYTVGSFVGGNIIKRFGIRASYRAVLFARTAVWATIAMLYDPATGTVALAALIPLFSLDYFFHSIGRVAEHSLQVAWYKDSEASSSRFGSFRDFIEYGTVFVGSAMALLIAAYGFGAVVYPAPFAFGLAALVALMLALPKAGAEARKPAKWNAGLKTVFKDAGIYKPLLGFALVNSFLYMMYYIVATAFGAYATTSPEAGAAVAGSLTGVYGLGALLGALVMDRLATGISKRVAAMPAAEQKAGERRLYSLSAARILPWAAAALLGSWLLVTNLQIGTLLWPMFPVSIALLAIGFTAQMASNHLDTIMKANIPKGEKDMVVGAIRALIYFSHVIGFAMWGGLFALFGTGAFALFAGFYTVAAAVYVWLARDLKRGL